MKSIVVDAPAKINLSLDITGIRENGYHNIDTVMQSVGLCDTVTISRMSGQGLYISCNQPRIPCDETNYAHIAASRFLSGSAGRIQRFPSISKNEFRQKRDLPEEVRTLPAYWWD